MVLLTEIHFVSYAFGHIFSQCIDWQQRVCQPGGSCVDLAGAILISAISSFPFRTQTWMPLTPEQSIAPLRHRRPMMTLIMSMLPSCHSCS